MTLRAHPNALPFASKTGPVSGFQIELGEALLAEGTIAQIYARHGIELRPPQ